MKILTAEELMKERDRKSGKVKSLADTNKYSLDEFFKIGQEVNLDSIIVALISIVKQLEIIAEKMK